MPYSKAHYVVALVLLATIIGFWPSYFGNLREAPLAFHFHGVIATAWIILLMLQAWSIHSGRVVFHRTLGRTSLILFPLLTGSLIMIANVSAAYYIAGGPYYGLVGPVFGYATIPPFIAYLLLYTQALRHRRQVHLHSGYMLGTAFSSGNPPQRAYSLSIFRQWKSRVQPISTRLSMPLHWESYCRCYWRFFFISATANSACHFSWFSSSCCCRSQDFT